MPARIGSYQILEEIGRGGMGIVFRAKHLELQREVALKLIRSGEFANAEETARFKAETEACARLQHPNIVPIYDVGEHHGLQFFTMAFIHGPTLLQRASGKPLEPKEAARLIQKLCSAVDRAHRAGIVHRDLKPANILFDGDGEPYITDFGLAKLVGADDGVTTTGQILGTPAFMPPEQALGRKGAVEASVDVYALGALLYFALTGQAPFSGPSPFDVLLQVLEREPALPRQLNREVPKALERICLRAMAKQVSNRYASAAQLGDDLNKFLRDEPIVWHEVSFSQRLHAWWRREPILVAHLCGIGITALIVTIAFLIRGSELTAFSKRIILLGVWGLASFALQRMLSRLQRKDAICLSWAAIDIVLYTSLLFVADQPRGLLLIGYPMLVCASGLFYRRSYVAFMTTGCTIGFLVLAWTFRSAEFSKIDFQAIFISGLAVIGLILSTMIRRIRALCTYYDEKFE
jgi:serine/threonine-protein kinase